MKFQQLFQELKRRNVFRIATAYAIAGWLIIQICTSTFPYLNLPDWLITAVIVFVGIGFPISLIFAWAFELTPEGLKKSREVDITESVTDRTGKKLNGIIITILSIAVIFLLVERVFFAEASFIENQEETVAFENASIAVLPFVNMSSDQENEYFSDGLSEELLNALAKIKDLKVAGRTSSFKFKGQNENLSEIGDELGVAHILEGSVRKDGNRVRITAQLIKVDDGYHLWSETYDRELDNIFAIQEEISRRVLDQLKIHLLPEDESELENIPTTDIEAYQAYLKANQLVINRDIDEINVAIELYNTAIKLDPSFAEAQGRLSFAYELQNYYGNIPLELAKEKVLMHAQIAMDLNDQVGESHQAMGVYYSLNEEYGKAKDYYLKALELNPNLTDVYNLLGNIYLDELDEEEEWKKMVERMYEVDPLSPLAIYNMGRLGLRNDDLDYAEEFFTMNMKKNPEFMPSYLGFSFMHSNAPVSRYDESFFAVHKAFSLDNNFTRSLSLMITRLMDLGMEAPAAHYMKIMQMNFRESEDYLSLLGVYGEFSGDFSFFEEDSRYFKSMETSDPPRGFFFDISSYAFQNNNPDLALSLIKKHYPELMEESGLTVDDDDQGLRRMLSQLYYFMGDMEASDFQTEKFCEFVERIPELEEEGEESDWYFFASSNCLNMRGNFEESSKYVEEILFERRFIGNTNYILRSKRPYDVRSRKSPQIEPLMNKVKQELDEQAENVRQYLKAEGEWKEEWEVTE